MGIIIYYTYTSTGSKSPPPPPKPFWYGGIYYDPSGNTSNPLLPPIPKEWVLAPLNATTSSRTCPPIKATLLSFGITNIIVAALVLVIGCRPIVHKFTLGIFGGEKSKAPYWSWVFSLLLQILANLLIAVTITHTDGYRHLSMLNLLALYSARPRISVIWLGLLRIMVRIKPCSPPLGFSYRARLDASPPPRSLREKVWAFFGIEEPEHVYWPSFVSSAIAEVCMEVFAAVFIGITWRRFPNPVIKAHMASSIHAMFAAPALTALAVIGRLLGGRKPFWGMTKYRGREGG